MEFFATLVGMVTVLLTGLLLAILFAFPAALVVYCMVNFLFVPLFGFHFFLTFWQAFGFLVAISMIKSVIK